MTSWQDLGIEEKDLPIWLSLDKVRVRSWQGIPDITTDAWGVTVHFECKRAQPVHLSGRWDFIIAYADYIGAAYAGWSLSFECPHPEWEEELDEEEK